MVNEAPLVIMYAEERTSTISLPRAFNAFFDNLPLLFCFFSSSVRNFHIRSSKSMVMKVDGIVKNLKTLDSGEREEKLSL